MKKGLIGAIVFVLCAWTPATEEPHTWQSFRAPYTEQAAVHFLKTTVEDALRLSVQVGPGGKKDPKACTECVIKMANNFWNLVSAVFEDQRIEDAKVEQQRQQYRGHSIDVAWKERMEDFTQAFTCYLASEQGQDQLHRILVESQLN